MVCSGALPRYLSLSALVECLVHLSVPQLALGAIGLMLKQGYTINLYIANVVLNGLCWLHREKRLDEAMSMKRRMESANIAPNLITYNILMDAHFVEDCVDGAMMLLEEMRMKGWEPDVFLYDTLINGFCRKVDVGRASEILNLMSDKGLSPDRVSYTCLMRGFCQKGNLKEVKRLFDEMLKNDVRPCYSKGCARKAILEWQIKLFVAWLSRISQLMLHHTVLIGAYLKEGKVQKALITWKAILQSGSIPDSRSYSALINGLCKCSRMNTAKGIFNKMRTAGPSPTSFDYNLLMAALCREGSLDQAGALFRDMVGGSCEPDVVSFNIMIESAIKAGNIEFANELLVDMQHKGLHPDALTFSVLINSFSKLRMMAEAKTLFEKMKAAGFLPHSVVYDSLLKGLKAVGNAEEIINLIQEMAEAGVALDDELTSTILTCICDLPEVLLLHEQVTPALTSQSTTVLIQDQRNDSRSLLCLKENAFQKTLDRQLGHVSSSHDGNDDVDPNQHENDIELQLLRRPELWYFKSIDSTGLEADHVVSLTREAFSACKKAMSIAKQAEHLEVDVYDSCSLREKGSNIKVVNLNLSFDIGAPFSNPFAQVVAMFKENAFQKTLDKQLGHVSSSHDGSDNVDPNQHENDIELQLLRRPELWYLFNLEADHVVSLAREAFSACKKAMSIAKQAKNFEVDVYYSCSLRGLVSDPMRRTVRSTRLLERKTKKRRVPKPKVEFQETNHHRKPDHIKRLIPDLIPMILLGSFYGPETTELLTATEEAELITKIQVSFSTDCLFCWGLPSDDINLIIHIGTSNRQKLIYANFCMVVHFAKKYQGLWLNLQDLMQEGSLGLMKSVEKFKPQAGCRFATYAYWWIRQSIRKALFQHSRTIRLPENVYGLLSKVYEAKKTCIQQGNHTPSREDIAACAGISVERMEKLLSSARVPLSMQQPEITADTTIDVPDVGVAKQLMRQHVRNLSSVLNPRERKIIRSRFGIKDGNQKTLSEIGSGFGLSKERVRQLESRALYKLRQCLNSQGLEAYTGMLI
ncbi:hypothetical protein SASPL_108559 [Salvia splendens]|uniref:RNA polymerase sigma-70 domain-containing protein n=1 Tax=Salvia splendens TaxID=180675 RepID=A0A8X8YIC2_SALSN|nr:hypothetical protein SASPL_108559 [Salvia splendens]